MSGDTRNLGFEHHFEPGSGAGPTLLLLHSGDGDQYELLERGAALLPGAALLCPRGPVERGGRRGFVDGAGEGAVEAAVQRLADFVSLAADGYGFDEREVIVVGLREGASLGAALLIRRQDVPAGAVLFHPDLTLIPQEPPFLSAVPVLLDASLQDAGEPPGHVAQLAAILEAAGADVTLVWHQGRQALDAGELNDARQWLQRRFSGLEREA